jgi:hypothetical protein
MKKRMTMFVLASLFAAVAVCFAAHEKAVPPAGQGIKATPDGYFYIDPPSFHSDFAADVPEYKTAFMAQAQVLFSADSLTTPVKTPA